MTLKSCAYRGMIGFESECEGEQEWPRIIVSTSQGERPSADSVRQLLMRSCEISCTVHKKIAPCRSTVSAINTKK